MESCIYGYGMLWNGTAQNERLKEVKLPRTELLRVKEAKGGEASWKFKVHEYQRIFMRLKIFGK